LFLDEILNFAWFSHRQALKCHDSYNLLFSVYLDYICVYTMCYMYYMSNASTVSNYFVFEEFRDE